MHVVRSCTAIAFDRFGALIYKVIVILGVMLEEEEGFWRCYRDRILMKLTKIGQQQTSIVMHLARSCDRIAFDRFGALLYKIIVILGGMLEEEK